MVQCPQCQANLKDDIGLVTCASCGAQILLELDGTVSQAPMNVTTSPQIIADPIEFELSSESAPSGEFEHSPIAEPTPAHLETDHNDMFSSHNQLMSPELGQQTNNQAPIESLQDVVDFANSATSQGRDGLLRFHVTITGIDTVDIRKKISDILSDQRFLWDSVQLLSTIQNGRLEIRDLTPVKAALFVQRLKPLPVEIYWEQYAIHQ